MSNIEKHETQGIQIQTLDEAMRYAEAMSGAGMIPRKFQGQPANVLVAQEIANDLGESTWMVMSELYFVGQVPTFSAKFMRSRIRQAGHKLREHFDKETMTARAVIIRHDDPEHEHYAEWDEEKARKHELWGKNHWLKNPELMLKNRALSEVMREACYEVMGGIAYTPDEAQDFVKMDSQRMDQQSQPQQRPQSAPRQSERPADDTPTEHWVDKIAAAETMQDLMGLFQRASTNPRWESEIKPMFTERKNQLNRPESESEESEGDAQEPLDVELVADDVEVEAA